MKVQAVQQLLGLSVFDPAGARIGRVTAAKPGTDPYEVTWIVVRLRGLRPAWRAVPASHATWDTDGYGLCVPYRQQTVIQSPPLGRREPPSSHQVQRYYEASAR